LGNGYQRSGITISLGWANGLFDDSLKYAVVAGKLYKYGLNNDYSQIFASTITGLKSNKQLFVNPT